MTQDTTIRDFTTTTTIIEEEEQEDVAAAKRTVLLRICSVPCVLKRK